MGLSAEASGNDAVRATGVVRGRAVSVEITGQATDKGLKGFLREFRPPQRQGRAREVWHTRVRVACENPARLRGRIESVVDVRDPAWKPGNYDPAFCRVVRTDPAELGERVITPAAREQLMAVIPDIAFDLDDDALVLDDRSTTSKGGGFVAASPIHGRTAPIVPWPERALVGPPWWIDLMCDLADGIDGAS